MMAASFSGFAVGIALCAAVFAHARKRRSDRIEQLTEYLESAALGRARTLLPTGEDDLSRLQDEMGKTVMALERTRTEAVRVKEGYARNLSYIAHQLRTPLSAIMLAAQHLDGSDREATARAARSIEAQSARLERLQEDLLLMAKLDAGVLAMVREPQDACTLLCMAVESVEDHAGAAGVSLEVVGEDPVEMLVDAHWTCEALMNVLKNCIEHAPAGSTVRACYSENPLYVEMRIDDEGPGFELVEEKRLFERFYTGGRGPSAGTGLGLAFARELLALQDASIRARARSGGGASFEIRFHRHPDVTLRS